MSNKSNYRKARLFLNTPVELAIYTAIVETEKLGGSEKLTQVIRLLGEAKSIIGDYIDELIDKKPEFNLDEYSNQDNAK